MAELYKDLEKRIESTFTRRKLHIEKYAQQVVLSDYMFDEVDAFYDTAINAIYCRFSKRIMVDHLPGKTVQHPSTWWDHFKAEKFPTWLKKKFPPKYKTTEVNFLVKYPHYKVNHSQLGAGYVEIIERTTDEHYNLYST